MEQVARLAFSIGPTCQCHVKKQALLVLLMHIFTPILVLHPSGVAWQYGMHHAVEVQLAHPADALLLLQHAAAAAGVIKICCLQCIKLYKNRELMVGTRCVDEVDRWTITSCMWQHLNACTWSLARRLPPLARAAHWPLARPVRLFLHTSLRHCAGITVTAPAATAMHLPLYNCNRRELLARHRRAVHSVSCCDDDDEHAVPSLSSSFNYLLRLIICFFSQSQSQRIGLEE